MSRHLECGTCGNTRMVERTIRDGAGTLLVNKACPECCKWPKPATLHLETWAGRVRRHVTVLGETPKRYRVRFDEDGCGGNWIGRIGETRLVPKYAVSFDAVDVRT